MKLNKSVIKMNEKYSVKFYICIFFILISAFFNGCKNRGIDHEEETRVLVETVPVSQGEIAKILQFTGGIEADAEVKIFPQLTATIKEIKVGLGDWVEAGAIMALLDPEELEAQFAQAKAALEVHRAKLAQMETGTRPEEIAQAEDLLTKAKAALKEAENNFNRSKDMLERNIISERQFESDELAYTVAKADLGSAQERLKMLRTGATKEDRDALKAQVRQAEAALELARIRLSYTRITSPLKGTVSQRFFETGDLAMPGKQLFTVVRMESVKAIISFQENQFGYLKEGTLAHVRVSAYPNEEFIGKIARVSPTLNPQTRMFTAEIRLDNKTHLLRPGMFATITFFIDPHPDAMLVPKESVLLAEGSMNGFERNDGKEFSQNYLFVVEGEIARKREVTLGHISGDVVEIRDGVKIGDIVITKGLHKLKGDDRIKIAE
ncbi:MAG: efflux RND transporter periplasmic adaptor subunit [Deltaproteobacteria bacterium]|nr:efflux RND transporter periplasmic adaptor subunit [Deltaproteobacteria bacterium]